MIRGAFVFARGKCAENLREILDMDALATGTAIEAFDEENLAVRQRIEFLEDFLEIRLLDNSRSSTSTPIAAASVRMANSLSETPGTQSTETWLFTDLARRPSARSSNSLAGVFHHKTHRGAAICYPSCSR